MLVAVFVGLWLFSTPLGAGGLLAGLDHGLAPLATREAAEGAGAVVVLGGGASTVTAAGKTLGSLTLDSEMRVLEAARVYRLIDANLVVASAGIPYPALQSIPESELLRAALVQAGVPEAAIVQESESRTTRDQARLVPPILESRGVRRFVLVTSPPHMRRALAVFRAQGLHPVPSVSRMRSEQAPRMAWWLPNDESLSHSDMAVYSYAAWVYYWWSGWLSPTAGDR
jgi:uncharacterized SAM-binding protein YcdF (DUF218 family)